MNCLDDRALIGCRGITRNFLWALLLSFLYGCWLTGCGDTNNATTAPPPDTSPGPLTITTTSLPDGTVNQPYATTLGASGGITPYTWSTTPALPANLTFNSTTSAITGTPAGQGTTSHTFTLQDSSSPVQTEQIPFLGGECRPDTAHDHEWPTDRSSNFQQALSISNTPRQRCKRREAPHLLLGTQWSNLPCRMD